MSLTAQEVQWVAHLARLHLTEAERETLTRQLSAIVDYVAQLSQVNTDGVEPMAHALCPSRTLFLMLRSAAASSTVYRRCWNNKGQPGFLPCLSALPAN
jgi:aspartyl/glutamyl-tRNA(Asn/Gln) amidotransferase C subunit